MVGMKQVSRDERGAILVLSTVGVVVAVIAAALAVDLGVIAHDARRNQKVADLAALDAARVLPNNPTSAAQKSATRNDFPYAASGYSLLVEWAPSVTGPFTTDPTALATATVVRVTARSPHKNSFLAGSRTVTRRAVAGLGNAIGTVRVGSKLASVSPMQKVLLDKSISSLIGGPVSFTAVGWEGLASGNLTFEALTTELASVTGNSAFALGTTNEVLNATFTAKQLFTAAANVLRNDGVTDATVATALGTIGTQANGTYLNQTLSLFNLFDFGSVVIGNKEDVANATLNVLELVRGGAILADGDHFASFDLTAADVVGPAIPGGFNSAKISMGLIEAPQTSFPGPAGKDGAGVYYTQAHTSQIRVKIELNLTVPLSTPLVVLNGLTTTTLTSVTAKPTYVLEGGNAHAYLDAIHCSNGSQPYQVDILGVTDAGTAKLALATDANLQNRTLTSLPVSTISSLVSELGGLVKASTTGVVSTNIPGNPGEMLEFSPPYTATSPSQPVPGTTLTLPAPDGKVTASVLGIVNLGLINDIVDGIDASGLSFSTSGPGVATTIVKPLYDALGLSFAGADVWAPPPQLCSAKSPVSVSSSPRPPVLLA